MCICPQRIYIILITLVFLCLLYLRLSAQSHYRFKHITTKDGLSTNEIECVFQDSRGFIWAGTRDGLNRYDGHSFKVYKQNDWDILKLSTEEMADIEEDSSGNLWIFTWGGLSRFDPVTETFQRFTSQPFHDIESAFELKKPLLIDSRNNVWVAGRQGALRMNIGTGKITVFKEKKDSPYSRHTSGLAEDKHGNIWMAAGRGWKRFDPRTEQWTYYLRDTTVGLCDFGHVYTDFAIDSDNNLWVFCPGEGFISYNIDTHKRKVYTPKLSKQALNPQAEINHIYEDDQKRLWISTFSGLYIFDRRSEQFYHYEHDPNDPYSLSSSNVHYSLFDNKGRLWVGTTGGGLNMWDPLFSDFEYHQHLPDEPNSLSLSNVTSTYEEGDTGLWIGTWGGGLNYFNRKTGKYTHYHPDAKPPYQLPGLVVMNMHKNKEGRLIVELRPGLVAFDAAKRQFERYPVDSSAFGIPEIEPSDMGNLPFKDSKGRIYACNWGGDVHVYDPATGKSVYFTSNPKNQWPYSVKVIASVLEDEDDKVWVATWRGGVYQYDPVSGRVKRFLQSPDDQPHLVNKAVKGLQKDKKGNIWAAFNTNIARFNRETQTFKVLQLMDQLPMINYYGFNKGKSGKFYLGTWNGLYVFDPENIKENLEVPPVYISNFLLNNQPVPVRGTPADSAHESPLEKSILFSDAIRLKHWQNDMTFEFTALNYTQPERNQYQYKLEGYNEDWVSTTARRPYATYTNLSPGTYTFRVIASNNDGIWNKEGDQLLLTILPPWWQTWWAYTIYSALIVSALYIFYRFQLNRQLAAAETIRLKELDAVKTRLYTNITHEFRTPLTIILGMAQQVLDDPKNYFRQGLEMIIRNGQNLLSLVNQMLDLSKLESGKMHLNLMQSDVISFLKYLLESFHSLAVNKNIQLHFLADQDELIMDYDAERLQQIISNLLSNAIKFTPENGNIYLSVNNKQRSLQIIVKDTGVGIAAEELPYIFDRFYQVDDSHTRKGEGTGIGLALTKELVKLMQGDIQVDSKPGHGSAFTVTLPIQQEAPHSTEPTISIHHITSLNKVNTFSNIDTITNADKPTILLIEDNADVVSYLVTFLQDDYQILIGSDGQQGIDLALHHIPDLIITDVMMPHKDGFEVCQTLKNEERTSHIPIIMLTAKADMASKLEGLERGADDYLAKPFYKDELLVRVRKLLELRRQLQRYYLAAAGLAEHLPPSKDIPQLDIIENAFVKKVRQAVEENLDNAEFTVEALCRVVIMSHSQLHRKLSALTGYSANAFIRYIRLNKAKELLHNPALTITAIAFDTGFNDPSYFGRVFKQEFGVTPQEWREQQLREKLH